MAAAEFLIFGHHIVGQLREIDREMRQSAVGFSLVGGITILLLLGWAFTRLEHSNQLLAERTTNLLRANHELTLAAKTSSRLAKQRPRALATPAPTWRIPRP